MAEGGRRFEGLGLPHSLRHGCVVAALLLAGCALVPSPTLPNAAASPTAATPATSAVPVGSTVPWVDSTPTPIPSPSPIVVPPGTAACAPGDLTATAGWQGATGQMAGWLDLTNVGQRPCVLDGSPRLVLLRSGTTTLDQVTYRARKDAGPGSETGIAGPVFLRPGDHAGSFLLWSNWCPQMIPVVTALLVSLPDGERPLAAGATSPGPGLGGTPRCDDGTTGSTFTAFAFVPVAPEEPPYESQPASVSLSVPPTASPGSDLAFVVTITNEGSRPASLDPCPTYTEDLIVGGRALKPPAPQQFLLNCAAIGDAVAPGASVTLQMRYAIPTDVAAGPVELVWGMDPGGPLDAGPAVGRAPLTIVGG